MLSGNHFIGKDAVLQTDRRLRLILLFLLLSAAVLGPAGCAGARSAPVLEEYSSSSDSEAGTEAAGDGEEKSQQNSGNANPDAAEPVPAGSTAEAAAAHSSASGALSDRTVTVHVCGAVKKEGVYTLPCGSRILDAVDAAGGFSEEADTAYLNLALQIEDAWQIRIPTKEEADALRRGDDPASVYGEGAAAASGAASAGTGTEGAAGPGTAGQNGTGISRGSGEDAGADLAPDGAPKVDLNRASKEDLMRIPGIGESKAQRILEYRDRHGRFEEIEDLMKIPGIKDASFQKMKEYVKV